MSARRAIAASLAAAALAVSACGGGGNGDGEAPPTFFGVLPQTPTTEIDIARMAEGGVGTYRLMLSWARVETQPGSYDWSFYDELLGQLAANGIDALPYVVSTPPHLAPEPTEPPEGEEELAAWREFLAAAAERYGPEGTFWTLFEELRPGIEPRPLTVWEIWNEPNSPTFWSPAPDPQAYAELFESAADAIGAVDPDARLMTAGMFATPGASDSVAAVDFLRQLYATDGLAELVDVVGIHPYGPNVPAVEAQIEDTRELMAELGADSKPVWVTEFGWGSDPAPQSELAKTPEKQAALLAESLEMMLARREEWKLEGAVWFTWRDSPAVVDACGWCASAGLLDTELDPKPAWEAFTELTGGEL